jgi:hypothetical protein
MLPVAPQWQSKQLLGWKNVSIVELAICGVPVITPVLGGPPTQLSISRHPPWMALNPQHGAIGS